MGLPPPMIPPKPLPPPNPPSPFYRRTVFDEVKPHAMHCASCGAVLQRCEARCSYCTTPNVHFGPDFLEATTLDDPVRVWVSNPDEVVSTEDDLCLVGSGVLSVNEARRLRRLPVVPQPHDFKPYRPRRGFLRWLRDLFR